MRSFSALVRDTVGDNRMAPSAERAAPQNLAHSEAGAVFAPVIRSPLIAHAEGAGQVAVLAGPPLPFRPTVSGRRRPPLRAVAFAVVVAIPVAVAAAYFLLIAADQYVTEFRFGLHSAAPVATGLAGFWQVGATASQPSLDSAAIVQYIGSRAIIDEIDPKLDLRQMFSRSEADWPARLHLPVSIEELVRYWRGQVDAFEDAANGTVVVQTRAFTAQDAFALARAVASASEKLVNELSARVRRDTLRRAEEEVAHTEERLRDALAALREFRDKQGVIDPGKTADTISALAAHVRDELERTKTQRATLKTYMRDDAPSLKVLDARIRSLEAQWRGVTGEVTATDKTRTTALSQVMGSYEELESNRRFAEAAYQHALEALDRSRSDADRQQVYVASFVPPSLPEQALYPRRLRSIGIVALVAFAIWAIGCLTLQSVRDHL